MSDLSTKRFLESYREMAGAPTFLSSFYKIGPRSIHNAEKVEIDVQRDGRPLAVAVRDVRTGGRINTVDQFTNHEFEVPLFSEEFALNAFKLMARQMGQDPFQDPSYLAAAQNQLSDGVRRLIDKIKRAIELQAAQAFKTGIVLCTDAAGNTIYECDFHMKASHKYGASVDWDETNANPFADLETGDSLVRTDSKKHIDTWVFGENAWGAFLANTKVQGLLDNRRIEIGGIAPELVSEDQIYMGTATIHGIKAALYTYRASYDRPSDGADTPYVSTWDVLGIASSARRDATFGGIPRIVAPDSRLAPLGIGSMVATSQNMALTTNAWVDPRGDNVFASVSARPLLIPVAIDAHVCLNAKVT